VTDTLFYQNMAAALRRRDRASKAIQKWQFEKAEAEAEIAKLTQQRGNAQDEEIYQAPADMPSVVTNNP
jgi:hypothetical protein